MKQISSVAVINRRKAILFLKRVDTGKWTLPGGHVEPGEEPIDAAVRELFEESGIEADAKDLTPLGSGVVHDKYIVYSYSYHGKAGDISFDNDPDKEADGHCWFDADSDSDYADGLPQNVHVPNEKNVTLILLGRVSNGGNVKISGKMEKMAIKDIPSVHQADEDGYFDYSHLLPAEHRNTLALKARKRPDGLKVSLEDHKGREVGSVVGEFEHGDDSMTPHSDLHEDYHGNGLGRTMYEALYSHAMNHHGIKSIWGGKHTEDAGRVHESLARRHGMEYKPKKIKSSGMLADLTRDRYQYAIKSEPHVVVVPPHKDAEFEDEDGWTQAKYRRGGEEEFADWVAPDPIEEHPELADDLAKSDEPENQKWKKLGGKTSATIAYRAHKNSPHNPLSLFLKYAIHRHEHPELYKDKTPEEVHKIDSAWISHHQQGGAREKNGHVTVKDLHDTLAKNPNFTASLLLHQKKLHKDIVKLNGSRMQMINGEPHIPLVRGYNVQRPDIDHSIASYADHPVTAQNFGDHLFHWNVPLKKVWYSYDAGPKAATSARFGNENEYLVSNHSRIPVNPEHVKQVVPRDLHTYSPKLVAHQYRDHWDKPDPDFKRLLNDTSPDADVAVDKAFSHPRVPPTFARDILRHPQFHIADLALRHISAEDAEYYVDGPGAENPDQAVTNNRDIHLIRNKNLTPDQRRRILARNPDMSSTIARDKSGNYDARTLNIAFDHAMSKGHSGHSLLDHPNADSTLMGKALSNPSLAPAAAKLTKDPEQIKDIVAGKYNGSDDSLSPHILLAILQNPNLSSGDITQILNKSEPFERRVLLEKAARNPNFNADHVNQFLNSVNGTSGKEIVRNNNIPKEFIHKIHDKIGYLLDLNRHDMLHGRKDLDDADLERIVNVNPEAAAGAVMHPNASREFIKKMAMSPEMRQYGGTDGASSPKLTDEDLHELMQSNGSATSLDRIGFATALKNPNLTASHLHTALKANHSSGGTNSTLKEMVVDHPLSNEDHFSEIEKHLPPEDPTAGYVKAKIKIKRLNADSKAAGEPIREHIAAKNNIPRPSTLKKGLLGAVAGMALAAGGAGGPSAQMKAAFDKVNPPAPKVEQVKAQPQEKAQFEAATNKWSPTGLHSGLIPIAHLESTFGQKMIHQPHSKGEYHTAYGPVGLKPSTAHEEWTKSKQMKEKFPGLEEPTAFIKKFKNDWGFHNLIASSHYLRLLHRHGTPEKAAYAWRWGSKAASEADDAKIHNDGYVSRYRDLAASTGIKKAEVKAWKFKDGISIPHHSDKAARSQWDTGFKNKLVEAFAYGDANRLRPVSVPVSEHVSGHFVNTTGSVGKGGRNRAPDYLRMLRGGDTLPPLVVRRNGIGWHVIDGNARLHAALKHGKTGQLAAYELVDPAPKGRVK